MLSSANMATSKSYLHWRRFALGAFVPLLACVAATAVYAGSSEVGALDFAASQKVEFYGDGIDGLRVDASMFHPGCVTHGVIPVTLRLHNGLARARRVDLGFVHSGGFSIHREVMLQGNGATSVTIPYHASSHGAYSYTDTLDIYVSCEGKRVEGRAGGDFLVYNAPWRYYKREEWDKPALLAGPSFNHLRLVERFTPPPTQESDGTSAPNLFLSRLSVPVESWPDDPLAYSPFDGVLLNGVEWQSARGTVRDALMLFAASGGTVFIADGGNGSERYFLGSLRHIANPSGEGGLADAETADAVLAACAASRSRMRIDDGFKLPEPKHSYGHFALVSHGPDDSDSISTDFLDQVPLDTGNPMRAGGMMACLAVFAVLLVPCAVIVSHRRKRPLAMLLWLPSAAFAIGAVVLAANLLQFGVTPRTRVQGVTILDQDTGLACTRCSFAVFSPVRVDRDIHFPVDIVVTTMTVSPSPYGYGGPRPEFDVGAEMRGRSGLAAPLTPAFFRTSDTRVRKERLEISGGADGAPPEAVNLLGGNIERLFFMDFEGRIWKGEAIAPGASVALSRVGGDAASGEASTPAESIAALANGAGDAAGLNFDDPARFLDWNVQKAVAESAEQPRNLRRGEYMAVMGDSPFLCDMLEGRRAKRSVQSIVYGVHSGITGEGTGDAR